MKRSFVHVINTLYNHPDEWVAQTSLPDGNGMVAGGRSASSHALKAMREQGLIEYGKEPAHSLYGWRLTEAGKSVADKLKR